nr:unnamed protein product [Callosobruchus analis]
MKVRVTRHLIQKVVQIQHQRLALTVEEKILKMALQMKIQSQLIVKILINQVLLVQTLHRPLNLNWKHLESGIRRSVRSRKAVKRLESKDSDKSSSKSEDWKYNDVSSSGSEDEVVREKAPPSKRVGARARPVATRKRAVKKARNKYTSDDSTEDESADESRRSNSRRKAATISYKEDSEEKTDSEDLLEVDNTETVEPVPEEKCETIEKKKMVIPMKELM